MQIQRYSDPLEVKKILQDIGVDPYGIKIMLPKALTILVRINSVSNITANIIKQEMLSLGADAAIARGALTGGVKKTGCLLMGNFSQLERLCNKLKRQPFGLARLSCELACALNNYQKGSSNFKVGPHHFNFSARSYIMGIINITPDSFSGDGLLNCREAVADYAQKLVQDGADIIDIGGESTRPGARPVTIKEELKRVVPVIKSLSKKIKVPISVDTHKPEVAKQALGAGALIVNDITGLRDPKMAGICAKHKCALVIMHMKGRPMNMQKNPSYVSLIDEITDYLNAAINKAQDAGVSADKIIVDPGIGFGKKLEHNLEILRNLSSFKLLGRPIMIGTSRKSFIGKILDRPAQERLFGTVSSSVLAVNNGANIVRTHDVSEVKQALKLADSINRGHLWKA